MESMMSSSVRLTPLATLVTNLPTSYWLELQELMEGSEDLQAAIEADTSFATVRWLVDNGHKTLAGTFAALIAEAP
jgi:hypothetical protein